jgi:hypothetical protein
MTTNNTLIQIIRNADEMIRSRSRVEGAIHSTWSALNFGTKKNVAESVQVYTSLRGKIVWSSEERADYDERFKNLPWEACGYQVPVIA